MNNEKRKEIIYDLIDTISLRFHWFYPEAEKDILACKALSELESELQAHKDATLDGDCEICDYESFTRKIKELEAKHPKVMDEDFITCTMSSVLGDNPELKGKPYSVWAKYFSDCAKALSGKIFKMGREELIEIIFNRLPVSFGKDKEHQTDWLKKTLAKSVAEDIADAILREGE